MRAERGQAAIEWTALLLVVSLALGALVSVVLLMDGRSLGGLLAHRIACAARGGCDDGGDELVAAYGERDAQLVRAHAPSIVYEPGVMTLPVDFRECRSHRCSDAPDDRDLDGHRSARGAHRSTAFTRVKRDGGETFIQYWLYYPDSTSTMFNAAGIWNRARRLAGGGPRYPPGHPDDWESYQVRIRADGSTVVRASSHHGYQGCKQPRCSKRWMESTGWTRVSWGSHAGHIPLRPVRTRTRLVPSWPFFRSDFRYEPLSPGAGLRERSTTAAGLRLLPLERIDKRSYSPLPGGIDPPWTKRVYDDPRSNSTS